MALKRRIAAGQAGHIDDHGEIHALLAGRPWNNVGGYPSLQGAHDDLPVDGGTLLIPTATTIELRETVSITKPVSLLGLGRSARITARGGDFHLLRVVGVDGFSMQGVTLDGGSPRRTAGTLVDLIDCSDVLVERCRLINAPETAIAITRGDRIWIERNHLHNLGGSGVRMNDPGEGRSNSRIWIARNHIQKHQQKGVGGNAAIQSHGDSSAGRVQEQFFIMHNRIMCEPPGGVGIGLDWANDTLVEGNVVTGTGKGAQGEGIAFTGSRNRIIGNRTKNTNAAGILLFATARGGNADNEIAHNICTDAADQGIALAWGESGATISNVSIHHNRCFVEGRRSQHWGVQSYAHDGVTDYAWEGVDLHDNNLRGNLSGGYNLLLEAAVLRRGNLVGPSSYDVLAPSSAWNGSHLKVGEHAIWVDSAGRLRVKKGIPVSDSDGSVVGRQS